jgi:hypothetical protein
MASSASALLMFSGGDMRMTFGVGLDVGQSQSYINVAVNSSSIHEVQQREAYNLLIPQLWAELLVPNQVLYQAEPLP